MRKLLILILLVSSFFVASNQLLAAGLLVTPDKMEVQTIVKESVSQDIYIKNISQGPVIYNLYSDELTDQINIQPNFIRLEPKEIQKIRVRVKPSKVGLYLTNIVVLAQDLNRRQFNAAAGAKVPLKIDVLPSPVSFFQKNFFWVIIGISVVILALDILIIIQRRKKQSFWQKVKGFFRKLKPWGHK
jgi:hypothetical protein